MDKTSVYMMLESGWCWRGRLEFTPIIKYSEFSVDGGEENIDYFRVEVSKSEMSPYGALYRYYTLNYLLGAKVVEDVTLRVNRDLKLSDLGI